VESLSFDRVADIYDATRGLPPGARDALTDMLTNELTRRGRCLEIGVGTGRIALPLHERDIPMVGTDISGAMLRKLIQNSGGTPPFPLLLADATRLPFADGSFGAALASHVLHLIPGWQTAVDEVTRVLRPGGVLLADFGERSSADTRPWRQGVYEALRRHGISRDRYGAQAAGEVASYLSSRARTRDLPRVAMTRSHTLRRTIEDLENQVNSSTWRYTADQMRAVGADIRGWAAREHFPLDEEVLVTRTIAWQAFELQDDR
jgi:ubiquinone/menaquinone biosynthesis C-methylase UbiE